MAVTEDAAFARAARRIVPLVALLYFVSFLDRVNVGFAALTMNKEIGLSAAAYGAGAGIFFIGYFIFGVPSNLILERVGARRWIAAIMVAWGLVSAGMALVSGPASFWAMRMLLGAAEAGFFPGIILYLTYWFPAAVRGRIMGWFLMALPISSVVGAPVSTLLLGQHIGGWSGWRVMFVVEGVPAVLLGLLVLRILPDRPRNARWLSAEEIGAIEGALERDTGGANGRLNDALRNPRVWQLAVIYLGIVIGLYGFSFWAPQMIKAFGTLTNMQVGLVTTIPYLLAAVLMAVWARRSDATGERRWHLAIAGLAGAAGFAASAYVGDPALKLAAFTLAVVGTYAALPVFWTVPTALLSGSAAAGGIALINAIGNLGGYAGPFAIGELKDRYGFGAGLMVLAGALAVAGVLAASLPKGAGTRG